MIYFLRHPDTGLIKIGTTRNYHGRLSQLKWQHGDLELLGLLDGSYDVESEIHSKFNEARDDSVNGREWFKPVPELLRFIETQTRKQEPINIFTNVQVDPVTHELLKALQQRYQTKAMWQALKLVLYEALSADEISMVNERVEIREQILRLRIR